MAFNPPAALPGKKRTPLLDLHTIADAIQNLPTDSSALLPSPVPFPHVFGSATAPRYSYSPWTDGSPGAATAADAASPPCSTAPGAANAEGSGPPPSASDDVYRRAFAHAIRAGKRRLKRDIARGRFSAEQFAAVVAEKQGWAGEYAAIGDGGGPGTAGLVLLKDTLKKLKEAWMARSTQMPEAVGAAADIAFDDETVHVLTQSLVSFRSSGGRQPPSLMTCKSGTVLSWTKYYKGTGSELDRQVRSQYQQPPLTSVPVLSTVSNTQPNLGMKRPQGEDDMAPPPAKKRLVSQTRLNSTSSICSTSEPVFLPGADHTATRSAKIAFDLVSSIASCPALMHDVCTHLPLRDILKLYRVSRVFKGTFDSDLEANVMRLARQFASPETIAIFPWRIFRRVQRAPFAEQQRAPTPRYVNMLVSRERKVRDILACLARAGHRLPRTTAPGALKKMWLLMDIPTNQGRADLLRNEVLFTDGDLLAIQMFHVKLVLHFHDPLFGPDHTLADAAEANMATARMFVDARHRVEVGHSSGPCPESTIEALTAEAVSAATALMQQSDQLPEHSLVETLLGQRGGFDVLWKLLRGKAYRTASEVIELKVRYDYIPPILNTTMPAPSLLVRAPALGLVDESDMQAVDAANGAMQETVQAFLDSVILRHNNRTSSTNNAGITINPADGRPSSPYLAWLLDMQDVHLDFDPSPATADNENDGLTEAQREQKKQQQRKINLCLGTDVRREYARRVALSAAIHRVPI